MQPISAQNATTPGTAKESLKNAQPVMVPRLTKKMAKRFWISKRPFTNNAGLVATKKLINKANMPL
jgi:hypothetical protein